MVWSTKKVVGMIVLHAVLSNLLLSAALYVFVTEPLVAIFKILYLMAKLAIGGNQS